MTPLIFLVVVGWIAAVGLSRLLAPSRQINAEIQKALKKNPGADPSSLPKADRHRIAGVRLNGAVTLAIAAAIFWFSGTSIMNTPRPEPRADASEPERAAFARGGDFLRKGKSSALVIGVINGDQEALVTLGAGPQSLFEIGSITKVFTGIALAGEVEEGKLKLDDKAASLLPAGFKLSKEAEAVTLRHLTSHTAGFPRLPGTPRIRDFANFILLGGDPYRGISLEKFGLALEKVKLESRPGEKMSYSNFGVSFLGWLLAKRNGDDYESYIRTKVLAPLEMSGACVALEKDRRKELIQGFRSVNKLGPFTVSWKSAPWNLADHLAAAGGIRANGLDMMKFLRANLRPSSVKIGAAIQRSHQELFKSNETMSVGMNWIRTKKSSETVIIWHNGGTGGFSSFIGFHENGKSGVFLLSNSGESVDSLGMELLDVLPTLN